MREGRGPNWASSCPHQGSEKKPLYSEYEEADTTIGKAAGASRMGHHSPFHLQHQVEGSPELHRRCRETQMPREARSPVSLPSTKAVVLSRLP